MCVKNNSNDDVEIDDRCVFLKRLSTTSDNSCSFYTKLLNKRYGGERECVLYGYSCVERVQFVLRQK